MSTSEIASYLPTTQELTAHFLEKYGPPDSAGWAPRRRHRFSYTPPAEVYEATVTKFIHPGIRWLDIGGGHDIFPENPRLAKRLVDQCEHVTAVDPSPNVHQNALVHEQVQCMIQEYHSVKLFDLATLRMVAEHIDNPVEALRSINQTLRPGGHVIIFTINKRTPISLVSRWMPFRLHHPIKKLFWGGEEEDTFPVQYKMNTRKVLRQLLEHTGFTELDFAYLDDCSTFGRFNLLNWMELTSRNFTRKVFGFYPENCLLGIYQKLAVTS